MPRHFLLALILTVCISACGGGGGTSGGSTGSGGSTVSTGSGSSCSGSFLGNNKLMIGAQMSDATAASAPFDARYMYLAGGLASDTACMSSCNASSSCSAWWGCWQDPAQAPGQYVTAFLQKNAAATWQNAARAQMPVITYYEILPASGNSEGANEVAGINNATTLGRYLDDYRFLLQKIGSARVMLHIEPDFWGYVRAVNSDPHAVPAQVAAANPTDCAAQENSAAGVARCMIAMTRKYAPNAAVGLHASPWNYQVSGDGQALGTFMLALGAADGDFIVTDPSDRDAGWYTAQGQNRWWTDQSAADYLAWSKVLANTAGKPTVMWQIPVGNMAQNNTTNHWQDNRVDYLFAHLGAVADARIVALLFGAGQQDQTTPETDGGNLIAKTLADWQAGGTPICQ